MQALFFRQLRTPLPFGVEEMCFAWTTDMKKDETFVLTYFLEIKAMILQEINTCNLEPNIILTKLHIYSICLDYLDRIIEPKYKQIHNSLITQKRNAHQRVLDKWELSNAIVANGTDGNGPGTTDSVKPLF